VPEGPRGGQNSPWLHEQLCERRIVLVTRRLDDAVAARAAAALISLDAASDAPIELHVNSPDGTLDAAFLALFSEPASPDRRTAFSRR
jgi:ATP-dependent Clp protease, protease subunit